MAIEEIALITGGGRGIGFRVAERLIVLDCKVIIIDRDRKALISNPELRSLYERGNVEYVLFDCKDYDRVKAFIGKINKKYGHIDILVNNVGGNTEKKPIEDLDEKYVKDIFEENFYTALYFSREVVPIMRRNNYGRIVNVSSIAGRTFSHFSNAAYVAAKAALIGLTKQLAFEEARNNIAVNTVAPGPISTQRITNAWDKKTQDEKQSIMAKIPAGRFGNQDEIAEAIIFLCSKSAGFCCGASIDANGGMYI